MDEYHYVLYDLQEESEGIEPVDADVQKSVGQLGLMYYLLRKELFRYEPSLTALPFLSYRARTVIAYNAPKLDYVTDLLQMGTTSQQRRRQGIYKLGIVEYAEIMREIRTGYRRIDEMYKGMDE